MIMIIKEIGGVVPFVFGLGAGVGGLHQMKDNPPPGRSET